MKRKVILGITGASGHIYARNMIDLLQKNKEVNEVALVFSESGKQVWDYEKIKPVAKSEKITVFENNNLFAAPSSGSAMYTDMIIIPCSAGTMGKIASGVADNLICRAADVMLKERRNMVLAFREAPLSNIHIKNMGLISDAGGVIYPLSPFFYHHPVEIFDLVQPLNKRILSLLGLGEPQIKWK